MKIEQFDSHRRNDDQPENEAGFEIAGRSYSIRFSETSPHMSLFDGNGNQWLRFATCSDITTSESEDATFDVDPPEYTTENGSTVMKIRGKSAAWGEKEQTWIFHEDFIETYVSAKISGALKRVDLLGGTFVGQNMFGESGLLSQRFFNTVYNPQPTSMERPAFSALESTRITTSGMHRPGRHHQFNNVPNIYGFSMSPATDDGEPPEGDWLMAAISAPIEQQNMIEFRYDAHEDGFLLQLAYDSAEPEAGERVFTTPSIILNFAPDYIRGMQQSMDLARKVGHLQQIASPKIYPWHLGTEFVAWGQQKEEQHRLEKEGIRTEAKDFSSESFVTDQLALLDLFGVKVDYVGIDDKWQLEYGTNAPDPDKWPNMPRFTDTQHALGRRAVLWWKLFDPEGLPDELCILGPDGRPIASDPTNPNYLAVASEQTSHMLSRMGLDADGLKLDFIAQLPNGPGLRWHGSARGAAALHGLLKVIYQSAKATKADALIEAPVINPWFADVIDQPRLNDTNEQAGSAVVTMGRRAMLALNLMPGHSIDCDGWPMLDKEKWMEYIKWQAGMQQRFPTRFSMTTHYSQSVNGEILSEADYAVLPRLKHALDQELEKTF